jgi:hypothetical protein
MIYVCDGSSIKRINAIIQSERTTVPRIGQYAFNRYAATDKRSCLDFEKVHATR